MKVTISVGGKFHAFYLALELQKRGFLDRLITSYPRYIALKEGIEKKFVISLPLKEVIERIYRKIPIISHRLKIQWYLHNLFDKQASRYVKPCDIFVGWSSFSLHVLRKAKSLGAVTILERGSSHIEYQRDIIKEEYEKLGIRPSLPDPRIVDKEIEEYEETDYISVPSAYTKRTFLEKGIPESKLIHVPYGVDSGVFKQIPKRDVIFRIIFVGQISIRKGIYYLLRAVSELKLKNLELCLIGNIFNETKPFFKKYRGYFSYLGKINFYQLYKYYSQGSVFVLPSIDDGFALVINQAMACGLPVISTFNTGGSEVVRDGIDGFIIPIRNIEALKEKILYLYNNPDVCKKMGESAKERVYRDSSWNQYGEKITKAYLSFLK